MYLKELHLQNFRNLSEQTLPFSQGFNYLYGANGAGKTALLESIYLLARGRSFRTQKAASVIASDADSILLRGVVNTESGQSVQLAMSKTRSGKTELRLNGQGEKRASALAKHLPVQTILPQAADLVLGSPGERRGFLDWGVFHVEQGFVDAARRYRRVLMQRNAWLKSLTGEPPQPENDPWMEQLLDLGSVVGVTRERYIDALSPIFSEMLSKLSPGLDVQISYDWGGVIGANEAEKKLGESWLRDVKFGMTHRGPHRADLRFTIADQTVSETVSRGQAKLISSAAILAQAELLYQNTGTKSLFLIDDFGAELDAEHWRLFLQTLLGLHCQVIATSTEPLNREQPWVGELEDLRVFHVEHGVVESIL